MTLTTYRTFGRKPPADAPRVLLSTGKPAGEGFDHSRLDTPVLGMTNFLEGHDYRHEAGIRVRFLQSEHHERKMVGDARTISETELEQLISNRQAALRFLERLHHTSHDNGTAFRTTSD
jgi:hypothetical protein